MLGRLIANGDSIRIWGQFEMLNYTDAFRIKYSLTKHVKESCLLESDLHFSITIFPQNAMITEIPFPMGILNGHWE